ncbi:MAG: hypothetical protein P1U61_01005 [Legionellaceae bacterium]|nr:hypothetical protein [Legionellaceae bacterium]
MRKITCFCLSTALLSTALTLNAQSSELLSARTLFSKVFLAPNDSFTQSSYEQASIDLPLSMTAAAFDFSRSGIFHLESAVQRKRAFVTQSLRFSTWDAIAVSTASRLSRFYRKGRYSPAVLAFRGPAQSIKTKAYLAPAAAQRIVINTNPMFSYTTSSGMMKTYPQTGETSFGERASVTADLGRRVIAQSSPLASVWGYSLAINVTTGLQEIDRYALNTKTAKPQKIQSSGIDLSSLSSPVVSIYADPLGAAVYVATATAVYYVDVAPDTGAAESGLMPLNLTGLTGSLGIEWMFSPPGADHFYTASKGGKLFKFTPAADNRSFAFVEEVTVTGLVDGVELSAMPRVFAMPPASTDVMQRLPSDTLAPQSLRQIELMDGSDKMMFVQGKVISFCGMPNSVSVTCESAYVADKDVSAVSDPSYFGQDVQGYITVGWGLGLKAVADGYSSTIMGCKTTLIGYEFETQCSSSGIEETEAASNFVTY